MTEQVFAARERESNQRPAGPRKSDPSPSNLPAIGAATRTIIIFITVLSVPLAAAETLSLSEAQTSSWILAVYGLPGLLGLGLAFRYRQPLLPTGNIFIIIFITRLGAQLSYPELIGASVLAGAVVLVISGLGLMEWLATWVPVPLVFGLLAGAVLSFVADIFNQLGEAPILVGSTLLAYLMSRRVLGRRVPAIFPALVVGLAIAAVARQFGPVAEPLALDAPTITVPAFSLPAILTATPVFVVLITLQSNLPSLRFLQGHEYHTPDAVVNAVSGIGTVLGSLLGPTGVSLSLPATSLVAGPEAGAHEIRHRAVYLSAGAALVVGLLAGIATTLADVIPLPLLLALAGLALFNVLGSALERITQGPLVIGPLFTFVITVSDLSLLGLGSFFWALVIGTGVSLLLERDELAALGAEEDEG